MSPLFRSHGAGQVGGHAHLRRLVDDNGVEAVRELGEDEIPSAAQSRAHHRGTPEHLEAGSVQGLLRVTGLGGLAKVLLALEEFKGEAVQGSVPHVVGKVGADTHHLRHVLLTFGVAEALGEDAAHDFVDGGVRRGADEHAFGRHFGLGRGRRDHNVFAGRFHSRVERRESLGSSWLLGKGAHLVGVEPWAVVVGKKLPHAPLRRPPLLKRRAIRGRRFLGGAGHRPVLTYSLPQFTLVHFPHPSAGVQQHR